MAGQTLARALAVLVRLILTGIVAWLTKKGIDKAPELIAELKAGKLGTGFAEWVEQNLGKLTNDPKLRGHAQGEGATTKVAESQVQSPSQLAKKPVEEAPPPQSSPTGTRTKIPPNSDAATARSLIRENESADILAKNGYQVEQNPTVAGTKNPDYKIDGKIFDNYAPETGNVRNIASTMEGKVQSGQADNIVVNLADSKASAQALQTQLQNYPIQGLKDVIIIDQSGTPIIVKGN